MTRVFEALRREQDRKKRAANRDPLAFETGSPGEIPDAEAEAVREEFELPLVIGSPTPPRSNEGMIYPSINGAAARVEDRAIGDRVSAKGQATQTNGQLANNFAAELAHNEIALAHHSSTQGQASAPARSQIANGPKENGRVAQPETRLPVARAPREIPVERLDPARLHQRLILLTEPAAPECEQYRTLRTQLFHAAEKRQTQVVVITSALAGEGKTATALNLALAIAQSKEHRVLVIDGDLRRPNVAPYLGLQACASDHLGFSEVLTGKADALGSIVCLDELELYVLPVGAVAANPSELLSSERLAEAIGELREYFDFIIVDSPPVMPFADARLLANHSDAVILVVRAEMTAYETVEKTVDALPAGRILGVVLNGAQRVGETDYYDYYYSYAQREQRRGVLFGKLSGRIRDSWLGRKMKL
ncbi:MAG: CpsD/CapB family tyrosine-protein kinase [Blastocatellia bacterium]